MSPDMVQRISLPATDNRCGFTFSLISVSVLIRMKPLRCSRAAPDMRQRRHGLGSRVNFPDDV
jgi:hypothetical protein